jgi:HEAT repeat protein
MDVDSARPESPVNQGYQYANDLMPKQTFDEQLAELRAIARGTITGEAVDRLRSTLGGNQCTLAAFAAQIAGHRRIADLAPDLVRAFDRFTAGTDKGCQAKIAIAEALNRLDDRSDEVYLRGIRHVQMEPAFGGQIDVAADLRAACAVALANMQHPQAACELTSLLVDKEINPRRAAIKSLAHLGTESSELVIRLKALVGDPEPDVMGTCFTALMTSSPRTSVPFVGRFLDSPDSSVAEQAALALGQSHEAEAFELLRDAWENNLAPDFRRMLLLPISLLRRDDAFEFLISVVENGSPKLADALMSALAVYADDSSRRKIRDAVKRRVDQPITDAFTHEFGPME